MHTTYDILTGKLLGWMNISPDHIISAHTIAVASGYDFVENGGRVDADEYYINLSSTTIMPRPVMTATTNKLTITADGIDTCTISTLPIPCSVTVDDATYEVTDGSFEFTATMPGVYSIVAESFPYKPTAFELTAI